MNDIPGAARDTIFISKATPEDDEFVLWLAPKLEAAGYKVFADVKDLRAGDRWRKILTKTLQQNAAKMLLCCNDVTLEKDGVHEEIGMATDLSRELNDPNFILPLRLAPYKKIFGIGELQYCNFGNSWAEGLKDLLDTLSEWKVIKAGSGEIQPHWEQCKRRGAIKVEYSPEILTSNWLRILNVPNELFYLERNGPLNHGLLKRLVKSFEYPAVQYGRGIITFCEPTDTAKHFEPLGPLVISTTFPIKEFMESGDEYLRIYSRDARNMVTSILKQSWENRCKNEKFLAHKFSNSTAYIAGDDNIGIGKKVHWGRQGVRRASMLRNISKGKVWEYGVNAMPNLYPYPHFKLKGRVLFSDMENREKTIVIPDKDKQHVLRRRICSGWRNKRWHGLLMAFMELLVGNNAYVLMPVSSTKNIVADAMPIQFTSPVTTPLPNESDENGEETDISTLGLGASVLGGDE